MEGLSDPRYLLSAAAAWMLSALVLACIATMLANAFGLGEQGIAYLSSALSFVCAAVAGLAAARKRKAASLSAALICAAALVIALLSIGFLIEGSKLNPSSILSLVSFTIAGVLFGNLILYHPDRKKKKRAFYGN